jgi:hypothetical protein
MAGLCAGDGLWLQFSATDITGKDIAAGGISGLGRLARYAGHRK